MPLQMRPAVSLALMLAAGACVGPRTAPAIRATVAPPSSPNAAEEATLPAPAPAPILPVRGEGPSPPAPGAVLTRIAVGSCSEETEPLPILAAVAETKPDLFLYIGDNVYGDARPTEPEFADPTLPKLRQAYADLNLNAHFAAFNMAAPMLATWNDHDFGLNDGGADFAGRDQAERIFETYWGPAAVGTDHPGVYGARTFGPPGRRVQIIMLDTRFFRSPLKTGEPDGTGRRPYVAQTDPAATMLGEDQWRWLAAELKKPAEVRLLVSSIQVLSENHPFEAWATMPNERLRLYETIRASGAKGVVLLSGDRHVGAMYRKAGLIAYPLSEMAASSLNLSVVKDDSEWSPAQVGRVYTPVNFGLVEIDWAGRKLSLSVRGLDGSPQRTLLVPFGQIGI